MVLKRWLPALALSVFGLTACDGDDTPEGILFFDPLPEQLVGLWTGIEEITTRGDRVLGPGGTGQGGFSFPVALELTKDRGFTLRSFGFPVGGNGGGDSFCAGVFRAEGQTIEFFPNSACRALPLNRFTIGRFFPDGLVLEAETGHALPGTASSAAADIRVMIRVERD